jgi:hypothetical protein
MDLESRHCLFSGFFTQLAFTLAVGLTFCIWTAWADGTTVSCPDEKIQDHLPSDKAVPTTLTISGTCTEQVVLEGFTNLTLEGSGVIQRKEPVVMNPGYTQWFPVLEVRGSEGINITNLTIQENPNNPATDSGPPLVEISRSNVNLNSCVIRGSKTQGLIVGDRSNVGIYACSISGSASGGVGISTNSNVDVIASTIKDNKGSGIGADTNSRLNISYWSYWWDNPNTAEREDQTPEREDRTFITGNGTTTNGGTGISAASGAQVNVGLVTIQNNPGGGVSATNEGFVSLGTWGEDAPTITGNGSLPYFPAVASSNGGEIWVISPTKIEDNRAAGAEVDRGGRLIVCCGPAASISHNDGLGIRAYGGGIVAFWAPALVQGNRRGGIVLNWSKASLNSEVLIRQNGDHSDQNSYGGLVLEANSSADGVFSVSDNYGPGVWIKGGSHALFGKNTSITGNSGVGVQLEMDATAELNDGVTVTGNNTRKKQKERIDLSCAAGTTAGAPKGTRPSIGTMSCPGWTDFLPLPAWQLSER